MKLPYIIQQKLKLAVLLFAVMVSIIFTNLIAKKNIDQFDKNFKSIYNDRLIPAKDIYFISENVHSKIHLLEKYLMNGKYSTLELSRKIAFHNYKIDSLIDKYEKTHLEEEEMKALANLKLRLKDLQGMENSILTSLAQGSREESQYVFDTDGRVISELTLKELYTMANLQSKIGNDLIKDARINILSSDILLTIQIVISVLIGVFISSLLISSKLVNQSSSNFNLN